MLKMSGSLLHLVEEEPLHHKVGGVNGGQTAEFRRVPCLPALNACLVVAAVLRVA